LFSMENRTFQYVDIPISGKNQWLRAIRTVDRLDKQLTELLFSLGIVLPLILIIITVGGYLILKRAFRPIQEITETAQFITQNEDYTKRIITKNNENELTELAAVINTMLASIESSFVREKQFNNDVSHELRTPVTVILSESEYRKNYAENLIEAKESFEVIHRQSLSMKKLVEQLLELTKAENPLSIQLEPLNFSIMMKQLVSDSSRLLDNTPIHLDSQIEDDLWIIGQQTLLKRLFDNLFSNAIK
ncbi:HAMP domain-containing histidine kinase, partial [Streptococcus agalactiae]|nr:HAMP domain-containing histidine kinase [Streptococcus agalactiae]